LRNRNALLVEENNRLRADLVSRSAYIHPGYVSGTTYPYTNDTLWNSGLWGKYLTNNGTTLLTNNQAKI